MEVRDVAATVWRHKLITAAVLLATVGLATAFAITRDKEYESTAVIALTPNVTEGIVPLGDQLDSLVTTYAGIANSSLVIGDAEADLGRPLGGEITTSTESGSGILHITARADDPGRATENANAVAENLGESIPDNGLLESRVVSPARDNPDPVGPALALVIGLALVLGVALALTFAVTLDHFRRRLATAADVRAITTAPVLAHVPDHRPVRKLGRTGSIWNLDERSPFMESMGVLRLNLLQLMREPNLNEPRRVVERVGAGNPRSGQRAFVFQISSARSAQGKSVTSAVLGLSFARAGFRTLVIDADLRRPCQHRLLEVENSDGFNSLLVDDEPPASHVCETKHENLFVIPSGTDAPHSFDRLQQRLEPTLDTLRGEYAVVLIDSSPLLATTDSRSIAPLADGVLMVAAARRESADAFERALHDLELLRAVVLGVALNRVKRSETAVISSYGS